jgi:hypothetical protein
MSINFNQYTINTINTNDINTATTASTNISLPVINSSIMIEDTRKIKDFKDQAFGGYKITQANQALERALMEEKLEPALHWALQLFLSGLINSLWTKLILFASKNINIYNPKMPEFLYNRHLKWCRIVDNPKFTKGGGSGDNMLLLRNHPEIRLLLCEMTTLITLAKKRKLPQLPRIKKEEFLIDNFKAKLEAKDNHLIEKVFIDGDPSEIKIAVNEMAFHILGSNLNKTLYWLNWIIEWEKINSKKYGKYECGSRPNEGIDAKYFKDVIWLIWAVIHRVRDVKIGGMGGMGGIGFSGQHNTSVLNQLNALWKLYCDKFTPAARSRKISLIIWYLLYMIETVDHSIVLVNRPHLLFQSMLGFDKIIVSLKSQEVKKALNINLTNVIVENNFMVPENHKQLEEMKRRQVENEYRAKQEQEAKHKKVNIESMRKLNDVYKLDRMMYS